VAASVSLRFLPFTLWRGPPCRWASHTQGGAQLAPAAGAGRIVHPWRRPSGRPACCMGARLNICPADWPLCPPASGRLGPAASLSLTAATGRWDESWGSSPWRSGKRRQAWQPAGFFARSIADRFGWNACLGVEYGWQCPSSWRQGSSGCSNVKGSCESLSSAWQEVFVPIQLHSSTP